MLGDLTDLELSYYRADMKLHGPGSEFLTADEQMYFLKAPLAHVVAYEGELRAKRLRAVFGRGLPIHYKDRWETSANSISESLREVQLAKIVKAA